jgi:phosphatidylglycerophosphate synthase
MATLHHPMIPIWIPIIMIARDVIVDATRMYASSKQVVIPANI